MSNEGCVISIINFLRLSFNEDFASRHHFFVKCELLQGLLFVPVSSLKVSAMGYISTWMGDYFSAILISLMALRLTLVDQNKPVTGLYFPLFWENCGLEWIIKTQQTKTYIALRKAMLYSIQFINFC